MRKFGLIGYPLGHSFSKAYFHEKFQKEHITDCTYDNYAIEKIDQLRSIINENNELLGLNVTIPYKKEILSYLDNIDDETAQVGAVNTIKINRIGDKIVLIGFNTDVYGFQESIRDYLTKSNLKAIILGTGGASKAVVFVLKKFNIPFIYVSRDPKKHDIFSYSQLTPEIIKEYTLIVNTSPLGMYPNMDTCPDIPYHALSANHILYDLVYNPEKTLFLKKGEQRKTIILNGMPMLRLQAEKSWLIWNS